MNKEKFKETLFISDRLKGRENNFDILRFIAATLVMYSHSFPLSGHSEPGTLFFAGSYGNLGVNIFFVISGFLITLSYSRSNDFNIFIKSRVLRIFPGLTVAILISAFILGPLITTLPVNNYFTDHQTYRYLKMILLYPVEYNLPGVFENNIFGPSVNGSLWTLEYEFTFYLIVLILGITKALDNKYLVTSIFIVSLTLSSFNAGSSLVMYTLYGDVFFKFFSFFSGGMLLYVYKDKIPLESSIAGTCIFVLFLSSFYGGLKTDLFVIIGGYLIIYLGLSPNINLYKFGKYGDFSYGLYIYAFPIQQLVTHLNGGRMDPSNNFLISFPITLIMAVLSWYFLERNFLKLKTVSFLNISLRTDALTK